MAILVHEGGQADGKLDRGGGTSTWLVEDDEAAVVTFGPAVHIGERYVERAVRSILDQALDSFEPIVVNNAFDDDTKAIVERLAASDPRVRYYRNPRRSGRHVASAAPPPLRSSVRARYLGQRVAHRTSHWTATL